jgi:hypothetical protein
MQKGPASHVCASSSRVYPLSSTAATQPPKGDDWLREDGYCFQVVKNGRDGRLYSKNRTNTRTGFA